MGLGGERWKVFSREEDWGGDSISPLAHGINELNELGNILLKAHTKFISTTISSYFL